MTTPIISIAEVAAIYCVGLVVFDYGCYFQAEIFTGLDHSRPRPEEDPHYHLLPHWSLWGLATSGLICFVVQFALDVSIDLALIFAGLGGAYFFIRYILMRRGIS